MKATIDKLLQLVVKEKASDLHITAQHRPSIRIDEKIVPTEFDLLTPDDSRALVYGLLNEGQQARFEKEWELDMSFGVSELGRFRVNVFLQKGMVGAAIRALPYKIFTFEECGLPIKVVTELSQKPKGLVLVTGATGSGKSTTLSSIVERINNERPCHIVTVEDPIEFVYESKSALIDQREVDSDTHSFAQALRHVLRQDPNVILIGEMRDLETIEAALTIAETGHLVFATLHTSDAAQTINRIIDVFPAHQQQQVRTQLSFVLLGVLSQQLLPRAQGQGRVLATEVLLATAAVRSIIRDQKIHQMYSVIQTSQREGMRTMNQALYELYANNLITYETALARTTDADDLLRLFKK